MIVEKIKYSVIDLFCGIGGLTHGFYKEKFNIIAGIDSDPSCKYAFETNNNAKFINNKIENIASEYLLRLFPKKSVKILIGCAPCQPFSTYSRAFNKDVKWSLLYEFSRLISEIKPEIVSMENVPSISSEKVFSDFIDTLSNNGYYISHSVVNCLYYGIPQKRNRLVLLASLFNEIKLIDETHNPKSFKTVRDAIGKLVPISDGEYCKKDRIHCTSKLSVLNKNRITNTPYGGSWKNWPEELKLSCHKKNSGKSYSSIYGRMKWEEPAPTMTTFCTGIGNGRFGHPEQDRAISLREAALIQTFPKYYKIHDPKKPFSLTKYSKHIGNAVPVKLGKIIAKSIKKHLEEQNA